jgi:putative transposase
VCVFRGAIIGCAVRWHHRFNLSLHEVEELLPVRGVTATCESVLNWCDRFGGQFARRAKAALGRPGSTWHLDVMFFELSGEPYGLWRAVDGRGAGLDVLLQKRCDQAAARRFVRPVLRSSPVPSEIVTDPPRSYLVAARFAG